MQGSDLHLSMLQVRDLEAGELLCAMGEPANDAWVVVTGRLRASRADVSGEVTLGYSGPGDLVGEAAMLDGGVRGADVRAQRRTRVACLDRAWLSSLVNKEPGVAGSVVRTILARGTGTDSTPTSIIGIVAIHAALDDVVNDLVEALTALGRHRVDRASHPEVVTAAVEGSHDWIAPVEAEHPELALVADVADGDWAQAVAAIADRLVLVADARIDPSLSPMEHDTIGRIPRAANASRMLVLVHPEDTAHPQATRAWLEPRDVDLHLHLRRDDLATVRRVARHVAGRALTVVMGAGGARSAACVGVTHALAERGVAVDAVAGVSGGAVVASLLARDPDVGSLAARTEWAMRGLLDFTLPLVGVIRGRRAWNRIVETAGGLDLADTWLPLTLVTTDLTDCRSVAHRVGPVADLLYATIAIPGVFPPIDVDEHLHVDGAVLDGLPVDAARAMVPDGPLLAVSVAPPSGRRSPLVPRGLSGWGLFWRRLVPGMQAPPVPSLLDTVMRSTVVAAASRRGDALAGADYVLAPDLADCTILQFERVREIIERGRVETGEALDAWLATGEGPVVEPGREREIVLPEVTRAAS